MSGHFIFCSYCSSSLLSLSYDLLPHCIGTLLTIHTSSGLQTTASGQLALPFGNAQRRPYEQLVLGWRAATHAEEENDTNRIVARVDASSRASVDRRTAEQQQRQQQEKQQQQELGDGVTRHAEAAASAEAEAKVLAVAESHTEAAIVADRVIFAPVSSHSRKPPLHRTYECQGCCCYGVPTLIYCFSLLALLFAARA